MELRVLVVDDDEHVRQFAAAVLERNGCEALQAEDSEEAFSVWREEEGRIDVLLVDVVLPGVRGDEVARRLAGEKPGLKCVFMSGFADEDFLRRTDAPAGSAFLPKPFAPHALVELVRKQV